MACSCARNVQFGYWESSSWTGLPSPGTAAWDTAGGGPHPSRDLKAVWMWCLGMWVTGGLGSAGLMVGLHDLRGLSQLK